MKARQVVLAAAALAIAAAACTQDMAESSADCASLLAQYDQATANASTDTVLTAADVRNEGERLCLDGKSKDGIAKLKEAISNLSTQ